METLIGKKIQLQKCYNERSPKKGMIGVVTNIIDDIICVDWESGSKMELIENVDEYKILN